MHWPSLSWCTHTDIWCKYLHAHKSGLCVIVHVWPSFPAVRLYCTTWVSGNKTGTKGWVKWNDSWYTGLFVTMWVINIWDAFKLTKKQELLAAIKDNPFCCNKTTKSRLASVTNCVSLSVESERNMEYSLVQADCLRNRQFQSVVSACVGFLLLALLLGGATELCSDVHLKITKL